MAMTRSEADNICIQQIELVGLPNLVDLLDTLVRFGDLSTEDDAEDKLEIAIGIMKQAAGRLMLRVQFKDEPRGCPTPGACSCREPV